MTLETFDQSNNDQLKDKTLDTYLKICDQGNDIKCATRRNWWNTDSLDKMKNIHPNIPRDPSKKSDRVQQLE